MCVNCARSVYNLSSLKNETIKLITCRNERDEGHKIYLILLSFQVITVSILVNSDSVKYLCKIREYLDQSPNEIVFYN